MTTKEIVKEQFRILLIGFFPLLLITFGILLLSGNGNLRAGYSLLIGAAFSLFLFLLIGKSAAKAVLLEPTQGERIVRQGFALRYALTAVFVVLAFKLSWINPFAAVVPLFYPKVVIFLSGVFPKKGG